MNGYKGPWVRITELYNKGKRGYTEKREKVEGENQ